MPFKCSLPGINPPQGPILLLNPLLKTLLLLVTSQAASAHFPTLPVSPPLQSLLPPHPPMTQTPLLPPLLAVPSINICHPIPLLHWSQLILSHWLHRNQCFQPCSHPLLHPHHTHPITTPIPPPKHAQPISTHSERWQELTALSEFMYPFL
jgi:hypothetical protein